MINLKDNVQITNKRSIYYNMIGKVEKIDKNLFYVLFESGSKNCKAFDVSEIRRY